MNPYATQKKKKKDMPSTIIQTSIAMLLLTR
jgi:hypothetical protein